MYSGPCLSKFFFFKKSSFLFLPHQCLRSSALETCRRELLGSNPITIVDLTVRSFSGFLRNLDFLRKFGLDSLETISHVQITLKQTSFLSNRKTLHILYIIFCSYKFCSIYYLTLLPSINLQEKLFFREINISTFICIQQQRKKWRNFSLLINGYDKQ